LEESLYITLPELVIEEQVSGSVFGQMLTKKGSATVCEQQTVNIEKVKLENHLKPIIPDVIAYINGVPILLEIAVTHFVNKDKQRKINNLGIFCIEIDLSNVARDIDLETIRSIVVDSVTEKKWIFHNTAEKIRTELKSRLTSELQSELEQIVQAEQECKLQEQQENLRQRRRNAREIRRLSQKGIQVDLGIPLNELPDFLDHPITGEAIFACQRRVWQAGLFSEFIFKKIQKYKEPYPISVERIFGWCEKYIPINLSAPENANRYTVIEEFLEHLEHKGFIEKYDWDKYTIINDTLLVDES
jgi:hypothetical protein